MSSRKHQAVAAFVGRTQALWVAAPPPAELGAEEVLCRTLQLGVCGTDREVLHSARPWTPTGCDYLILGHECLARVEAVGSRVQGLEVGSLVAPTVRRPLGAPAERPDLLPLDAYTERGIVRAHGFSQPLWCDDCRYLLPVPEQLAHLAVFTEPQSIAEKAVNEASLLQRARLGDDTWRSRPPRVLATGMGPIAFAAVVAAVCRGWPATVYGRDSADSPRVALARQLGADYREQRSTDLAALAEPQRFDLILECTGDDRVLLAASQALAHCGTMVWLGASRSPQPRNHNLDELMRRAIVGNQLHLGTVNAAPRDFADAIEHLTELSAANPRAAAGLITRRASFEESLEHFARREPQSIKTVYVRAE